MQGGASIDQFYLPTIQSVNRTTGGINLSSNGQTVSAAVRNLILVLAGQSNGADVGPSAYSPANPTKIDQLSVYDGAIRVASDPLIGPSYPLTLGAAVYGPGNVALRLADNLITANKFDRVVIVPIAVGATLASDWVSGGICGNLIPVAFRRLTSNGIVAGANITETVLWMQGESDTDAGTAQAAYTTSLNSVIATSRTAGFAGIWFVAKESRSLGVTSANVTAAQAAVVNHGSSVWAGPDLDALNGNNCSASACRQGDDTHFSDAGMASAATAWATAMALAGAPF